MRIAIDDSPITSTHKLADKIRGTGFYIKNLIEALENYHPEHKYIYFRSGESIPKADIYHYPYFEPFFLSLPSQHSGKIIVTIHDLTPLVFPKLFPVGIKGKLKLMIQRGRAKKADGVITDSDSSKRDINRLFKIPLDRIHAIPLAPADIYKKIKLTPSERKKLSEKYKIPEKFALYVGDATPNKNLKTLVDAAVMGGFPLVMVGGALVKKDVSLHPWNNDLLYVQKIAQNNSNIFLPGYVSDADLALLYNCASVFVFPSLYEGFGLPVLEAAACGAAIVTSKMGSIPEVIGDSALYVDQNNSKDITEAVLKVIGNDKERKVLGAKSLERAKEFSWRKTADLTVSVYEEVFRQT